LLGHTAIVTGSTSGIGLGIAQVLAGKGANIVLNGFGDPSVALASVKAAARSAGGGGGKVIYVDADLTDAAQIQHLALVAGKELGVVDIVVNNAGMQHVAPVSDFELSAWEKVIKLNLTSAFVLTKALLPAMVESKFGRVINVASVHGLVGSVNKSAYVASKHGIVGFTKVLALEVAGTGVTANAICPGWVLTPLVEAQIEAKAKAAGLSLEEASRALLAEKQPSKQFATPTEIGELAAFLAGKHAAQITGASIPIDGGWTAH